MTTKLLLSLLLLHYASGACLINCFREQNAVLSNNRSTFVIQDKTILQFQLDTLALENSYLIDIEPKEIYLAEFKPKNLNHAIIVTTNSIVEIDVAKREYMIIEQMPENTYVLQNMATLSSDYVFTVTNNSILTRYALDNHSKKELLVPTVLQKQLHIDATEQYLFIWSNNMTIVDIPTMSIVASTKFPDCGHRAVTEKGVVSFCYRNDDQAIDRFSYFDEVSLPSGTITSTHQAINVTGRYLYGYNYIVFNKFGDRKHPFGILIDISPGRNGYNAQAVLHQLDSYGNAFPNYPYSIVDGLVMTYGSGHNNNVYSGPFHFKATEQYLLYLIYGTSHVTEFVRMDLKTREYSRLTLETYANVSKTTISMRPATTIPISGTSMYNYDFCAALLIFVFLM